MHTSIHHLMKTTILMSLLVVVCPTAHARDPVKLSPQYYKVLVENDQVRVLEYRLKAGEKEPMHSHPAGVVYVLSGAKLKFSYPDAGPRRKLLPPERRSGVIPSHMRSRMSAIPKPMPLLLT
jgi:hypothetical protein